MTVCDASQAMLANARAEAAERELAITFVEGVTERLPFPDACFDAVTGRHFIWTLVEPDRAFAEWRRVLVPSGILVADCSLNTQVAAIITPTTLRRRCRSVRLATLLRLSMPCYPRGSAPWTWMSSAPATRTASRATRSCEAGRANSRRRAKTQRVCDDSARGQTVRLVEYGMERERLSWQGEQLRPATERLFRAAGIGREPGCSIADRRRVDHVSTLLRGLSGVLTANGIATEEEARYRRFRRAGQDGVPCAARP
ncbi:class I SAM-dependent methyltransferase [Mycobacterium tilburgii]|uniref:class I SAM-dependent methyltransferase n=1 Tax=Mycobacterium tilburgii TaxID=44467 RepID=UPI0021B24C15|nr:class I SAM-dependent methyltransferase [Mycobacterium tilburgii]